MGSVSAGSILGRSFSIWLRNFVPFTLLSLVVHAPLMVWVVIMMSGEPNLDSITRYGMLATPIEMVLGLIATGAMTYGVFMQLRGQPAGIGKCLSVGLSRLFPILGVGLLAGIAIIGGFILLIVPGVIIMCALWVAVPVAVVERPGVGASLSRSSALTKGYRGSIFGVILLIGVLNWLVSFVTQKIFIGDVQSLGSVEEIMSHLRMFLILSVVEGSILGALSAVAAAVGYHDLRVAKEGVAVEQLAAVFD
jgi:hypothetical protein